MWRKSNTVILLLLLNSTGFLETTSHEREAPAREPPGASGPGRPGHERRASRSDARAGPELVSRAFTKEDTADLPLQVPRAPLPDSVPNYVTRRGLALLREERSTLEAARPRVEEAADALAVAGYQARLSALSARIQTALVLETSLLPRDEVRFSALVGLRAPDGQERHYRIVGVDEAEPKAGRIAFTAPLAAALTGKRVGDTVTLRTPSGELEYEITTIDYSQE